MSTPLKKWIETSNFLTVARVLPKADLGLAVLWWIVLVVRGLLPAGFAISMGLVVGAVQHASRQHGPNLGGPLLFFGAIFVLLQILPHIHRATGANLGSKTATWLYDQLTIACLAPAGMAHLENSDLATDMTVARDFDLAITAPPMAISIDFLSSGLVEMVGGIGAALLLAWYSWWAAALLAGVWGATHWMLRESTFWKDRNIEEVRQAQRQADYAYRLAVEPPSAKEVRLFGLADWIVEGFRARRKQLFDLRWDSTRFRETPLIWSILLVIAANVLVFWYMSAQAFGGRISLTQLVIYASAAVGISSIAFGGLSWALDDTAAPMKAVARLKEAMANEGRLAEGRDSAQGKPAGEIRFRNVTFRYPRAAAPVLSHFDLTIPAGASLAIVGQNGAGKTTIAKLLCRLYDPEEGSIEVDGVDLRTLDIQSWRSRVTAVFQDFIRFEWPLSENVAPSGAPERVVREALADAGAGNLGRLDTVLSRAYPDGTDLSGGQWQRIALARSLCAVKMGAGLVLLDEPTAQLDVRGEAEIFRRVLEATRQATTILISHRFSTVRQVDRICVLEQGKVIEIGSHDELMAAGGRYKAMFELQAARFDETEQKLDALD